MEGMTNFQHGSKAIIDGRKVEFGTVAGYAEEYRENPTSAVTRATRNRHETHFIILMPAVLCGDKGYYEREQTIWADAAILNIGAVVVVTDSVHGKQTFRIESAPNHNFRLVKA